MNVNSPVSKADSRHGYLGRGTLVRCQPDRKVTFRESAAGAAHHRRCRRARAGVDRHRVQGAQRARTASGRDPRAGAGRRGSTRLPAERARPRAARRAQLYRRADHHGQLRPLHHPDHARRRGRPRCGSDLGVPLRWARRRDPRAALHPHAAGAPGGRHHHHRPANRPAPADRRQGLGTGRLRDDAVHRPGRLLVDTGR